MRTVWTMGFVAAAALSFCFPDFIVFRFTQATIWAIALLGLVLLCGVSGQFSFAQAALFGIGGYSAAIIGTHTPLSVYWGLPAALLMGYAAGWGLGRIAGGHSLWTQALVTYAFAIAFPQFLRWHLIEGWTGGVGGLYLDFPTPPGGLSMGYIRCDAPNGRSSGKRRTTSVVRATLRCTPATSSTASATSWVISVERTVARADGVAAGSSQPVAATPSDARPAAPSAVRRVSRRRGRRDTR